MRKSKNRYVVENIYLYIPESIIEWFSSNNLKNYYKLLNKVRDEDFNEIDSSSFFEKRMIILKKYYKQNCPDPQKIFNEAMDLVVYENHPKITEFQNKIDSLKNKDRKEKFKNELKKMGFKTKLKNNGIEIVKWKVPKSIRHSYYFYHLFTEIATSTYDKSITDESIDIRTKFIKSTQLVFKKQNDPDFKKTTVSMILKDDKVSFDLPNLLI